MVLRAWPWTIALAGILAAFVLIGLVGVGLAYRRRRPATSQSPVAEEPSHGA